MSLQRTDTGETAKPLQQLQERNIARVEQTDNALLKEALAVSNEKCNVLIERQSKLVEEIRAGMSSLEMNLRYRIIEAVSAMEKETLQANQIKSEIHQSVKAAVTASVDEMKDYAKRIIAESLKEVKSELTATAKEIQKQREEYKLQGSFRKLLFWATPALLLIQAIVLIVFMN